jgi:2-keto-3-deoxy-L-rhamnonate aldolase RhmA
VSAPSNLFRARLAAAQGHPIFGTWLMANSVQSTEALGMAGFDFLVVDMEHVPLDLGDVVRHLMAVGNTPAAPVTRVPWNDFVTVKRVLDTGAQTLMFPFIQNAEECRAAIAATRYPPDGIRGVAGSTRASGYGLTPNYLKTANTEIATIMQLETPEAVEKMAEIAAVPGVDALFIGPADLSANMGLIGDMAHPAAQAALKAGAAKARALGKPVGIIAGTEAIARDYVGYGFNFVALSSDLGFIVSGARGLLSAARGITAKPAGDSY